MRKGKKPGDTLMILINFRPVAYEDYCIGVDKPGAYKEAFNSDETRFGGGGFLNEGPLRAEKGKWHGRDYHLSVKLPALGMVILKKGGRLADTLNVTSEAKTSKATKKPTAKSANKLKAAEQPENETPKAVRKGKAK